MEMLRGAFSAGRMKRGPIPLWSATIIPSLWEREEERQRERGALSKGGGERGREAEKNRTRSVYDSTLCEGRLPCVSHRLSQVERTQSTDTELSLSVIERCLSVKICFMSWRATGFYFSTLQDTFKGSPHEVKAYDRRLKKDFILVLPKWLSWIWNVTWSLLQMFIKFKIIWPLLSS